MVPRMMFVAVVLCALISTSCAQSTTLHIAEIFVGKCFLHNPTGVNCTLLWETFSTAAMIGNNVVNDSNYAPFFQIANFSTAQDHILFWSGNQAFALLISDDGSRYTTVEGTSTGYVLNQLSWCGVPNANPPSFDYSSPCLYPSNATYYGTQGVWAQASKHFAQGAHGNITILLQPARLNYDSGPYMAYRNTSVFHQIELPNINASRVTDARVLLISNLTLAPNEKCGSGSLLTLAEDLKAKFGFEPECLDDPALIYDILCPDDNTATAQCLAAALAREDNPNNATVYFVWALSTTIGCAALLVLVVYFSLRSRRGSYSEIH